jgi:hypothetical protein
MCFCVLGALAYFTFAVFSSEQLEAVNNMNMRPEVTVREPITLSYPKPSRKFERNQFTVDEFVVNGVNLATYGFETEENPKIKMTEIYQLYDSFDIGEQIKGNEGWWDLVHYHRDLKRSSLIFYMDKVAQKRYMKAVGYPIPKSLALYYREELWTGDKEERAKEESAILNILPEKASYVVKPTHKSSSSGVWLVRYDPETQQLTMGYSGDPTETKYKETQIVTRVVRDLHVKAGNFESWALLNAHPGVLVEERFSSFDSNTKASYEFKTFTIWGRVYLAYLKRGSGRRVGLVKRDGTMLECKQKHVDWERVPDWLQWDKVVALAEQLGRNKDLFRVDIFVGIPSGSAELGTGEASAMKVVVSETEFHPTTSFPKEGEILEEGARLWMAGYRMGIYKLILNSEVPKAFLEKGYLSEKDLMSLAPIKLPW